MKEYQDLYRAGVAAARAKDFDRARKLFLAAVTLDEQQKSGWLALARLETDTGRKADYYRRVLQIDPKDAVARAFLDGMRRARVPPWYRWAIGLLGLLALLGGILAAMQSGRGGDTTLPTQARLPSLTPSAAIELAAPLNMVSPNIAASEALTETASPTPDIPLQATITPSPSPTLAQQAAATPTLPLAPTTIFNPPPPSAPTPGSGIVVTIVTLPPTSTSAAGTTATPQPLFMDITEPPPTELPIFATPTLDYQGDFNTEAPPPDQTFPEDPNSGGIQQP